ncbi:hypothetical protein HPP92_027745 [Vanilla planifolia]|uniref:DEK-C domain-containing protein n=1 Tax=Vanilla planifolia TaxID=51239 RepID=A0A835U520_VANPL|nr:hypothetical protein HPP92_027745 [Vanilla planifolia]
MRARVRHFKEQADSFTLEGVRRALEKDMGLDIFSLDAHKRFIKQCLEECFSGDDEIDKSTTIASTQDPQSIQVKKKIPGEEEEPKQPKDSKSSCDVDENAEESLADDGIPNSKLMKTEEPIGDAEISEDIIKKAIKMRGSYFKENLEKISLAKVRRQLEEDLNVKKNTLDAYKNFISDFLYKFLQTPETLKTENDIKKKIKESFQNKKVEKVKGRPIVATEDLGSSNLDDDINGGDVVDEAKRPKKRSLKKSNSSTKAEKKLKTSSGENKSPVSKKMKAEEIELHESSESEQDNSSQDRPSPSASDERPKVIIADLISCYCKMEDNSVVYKRVKQAPEGKREALLIKELEEILEKEGLSSDPSEKEIRSVKKRKETARELEGIDMSNIVSTSRRRSTSNYIPVPKQKIEIESDEYSEEDEVEGDEEDADNTDEAGEGSGESHDESEGGMPVLNSVNS